MQYKTITFILYSIIFYFNNIIVTQSAHYFRNIIALTITAPFHGMPYLNEW
jgi:hypothetical protein